ncbi:hypothetical protein [Streptomyces sp. NRRL F-2580]|uniref:hypothetical protein n=1 Tax=Streptomyces sp. NRRL F-2580 TaxID=1463841 RepID=UPI00131BC0B8|nr:hypothetical protein [Streptomyces sp. NRRL F-2580]
MPSVDPSVPPTPRPTTPPVTPKPKPSVRAYVTTVKLADGSVAKVYKIGDNHFEADIFAGSTKLDTLVSKGGAAAYGQNDGLHVEKDVKKESPVRVTMPDGRIAKPSGTAA